MNRALLIPALVLGITGLSHAGPICTDGSQSAEQIAARKLANANAASMSARGRAGAARATAATRPIIAGPSVATTAPGPTPHVEIPRKPRTTRSELPAPRSRHFLPFDSLLL